MPKSHDYKVMTSLTSEAKYPMEPFEWGLPAVQIWYFYLLHDWRYIDFQSGLFAIFKQFKIDSHFGVWGKSVLTLLVHFTDFV